MAKRTLQSRSTNPETVKLLERWLESYIAGTGLEREEILRPHPIDQVKRHFWVICWVIYFDLKMPVLEIAAYFRKQHSTVLYALTATEECLSSKTPDAVALRSMITRAQTVLDNVRKESEAIHG